MSDDCKESNRLVWEDWTALHLGAASDYQAEFAAFKAGEITLTQTDLDEVGEVAGKSLLHLMCHLGLDSLSWARRGARVTGVDFSRASIAASRELAAAHALRAEFVCADACDLPARFTGQFDVVYTEGGVLAWLPDVNAFVQSAARCLRPGGVFYLRDSHPFRRVLFPLVKDRHGELIRYEYFSGQPTRIDMRGSYARPDAETNHQVYFWVHGIGEVVSALCAAGLRIEFLHEFPKVYTDIPVAVHAGPGQFDQVRLEKLAVPSSFSIRARLF
jgi:SAM-dependent methyltransferase